MPDPIKFLIETKNLGPLVSLNEQNDVSSLKIGIFANNGIGKTFISRALRLTANHVPEISVTDKLLTLHRNDGEFMLCFSRPNDTVKQYRKVAVSIKRGIQAIVNNDTGYIFHVFNSDFVSENLEAHKYSPDSNIDGYILGKVNIDLTKEKDEIASAIAAYATLSEETKSLINKTKKELDTLGVNKNTNEYKYFCYENLCEGYECSETEDFSTLKNLHNNLKSMPDDLEDIPSLSFNSNIKFIQEIIELLTTPFALSVLAEDFKEKVKKKQDFIIRGVELYKSNTEECPFCEQPFSQKAINLIDLYNKYLEATEAKIISEIEKSVKNLKTLQGNFRNHYLKYLKIKNEQFNTVKQYIPSYKKEMSSIVDPQILESAFEVIIKNLDLKKRTYRSSRF